MRRRAAAFFVAAVAAAGGIGYGLAYHRDWVFDTLRGADARATLVERPCGFTTESGRAMVCYDFNVPESRDKAGSRLITLPIIVFKAPETPHQDDPVLLISGGPGAIAYTERRYASIWKDKFKDLAWLKGRDLIVYDQRGVGGARPALECPEIDALRDDPLNIERSRNSMSACRQRLEREGVDLLAYDTNSNVDDILTLQAKFGVKAWNLWGQSYGTRVVLTLLRRKPAGVRSAILDGAYPPEVAGKLYLASAFNGTMGKIFEACAADETCKEDFPNLRRRFEDALARLKARPAEVKSDPAPYLPQRIFKVDDVIFLSIVDSLLYTADGIGKLPWLIDRVAEGKDEWLEEPLADWDLVAFGPYITAGISYLVDCNDTPDTDDSDERQAAQRQPHLAAWLGYSTAFKPCPYWTKRTQPSLNRAPVASEVPTIVIAGGFDLATPPEWGVLTARALGKAQYLLVPGASHDASDHECAKFALTVFIERPGAEVGGLCRSSPSHPTFKRKSDDE